MPRVNERGITLVEVLVTILVVVVGVIGAMSVFDSALRTSARAERIDVAANLGDRALEDLRALPYDEIAVHSSPSWPATPSGPGEPADRIAGGLYQVPDGPREELVAYDPASPYPNHQVRTVGGRRLAVYRFVSWRDEECPLVDLAALDTVLADLQTALGSLTGTLGGLLGPGGSLTSALDDGHGLLSGGLLGGLGLGALLSAVVGAVDVLEPLEGTLAPLVSPLQGALAALDAVVDPVTGRLTDTIDLCDLPPGAIPDLHELEALAVAVEALDPVVAATAPVVAHVGSILRPLVSLNLFGLLGAVVQAPAIVADTVTLSARLAELTSVLGGVVDTLGEPVELVELAGRVTDGLSELAAFLASPDTTHNTKRISVAVQPLDAGGDPLRAPMWFSTIVTDPEDGLL